MQCRSLRIVFVLGALVGATTVASPALAGPGTPIVVTTTADVVDAGDGVTSLREAVTQADAAAGDSVVDLDPAGATYELTLCGGTTQEDANADGDLDHTATADELRIRGGFSTIVQTCFNERLLDSPTGGSMALEDLELTGGNFFGQGGGVRINFGAGEGDLYLGGVDLHDNFSYGDGGGVLNFTGPTDIWRSSISRNTTELGLGAGVHASGGPVAISNSTISHNWSAQGEIGGLRVAGWPLELDHTTILANRADSTDEGAASNMAVTIVDATASVVALGVGAPDCWLPSVTDPDWMTSHGANIDSDGSCRFVDGTDLPERHPMLALADDQQWTTFHRPAGVSPAVDAVSSLDCTQPGDQLGDQRDQGGTGCDSGAIEVLDPACTPTFPDVSAGHAFFDEICWMAQMGITTGFDDGRFRPASAVTRQSMSAFLYRWTNEPPFAVPDSPSFTDVAADHQFATSIEWMAAEGISTGFPPEPTYRPSVAVTRQSMSAFLYRVAGEPPFLPPAEATFDDVSPTHPFFAEIEWMAATEITTGFSDDTYRPASAVTRQSMSAFLLRLAQLEIAP